MNKLTQLISQYCPDGVEFLGLEKICLSISAGGDLPKNYVKGQKLPTNKFPYPIYSNGTESSALYGYTDGYKIDHESVTISARGTIGYHTIRNPKFTPIVRLITLIPNTNLTTAKFLNYALDITEIGSSGGSIPQLTVPNVKKIQIPIPPLPVQQEIVRILDTFTQLEAELEAELEARKSQYEYYRDDLLSFEDDEVEWKEISELTSDKFWIMPATPNFITDGEISYITSKNIKGGHIDFTNIKKISQESFQDISKNRPIIKDDILISMIGTIGEVARVKQNDGDFYGQNMYLLRFDEKKVNIGYFLHFFDSKRMKRYFNGIKNSSSQGYLKAGQVESIKIPIPYKNGQPDLEKQQSIVTILDKFDALVNDISIGLPAELQARRQQYEYYRNKLLTFKPLEK